MQAQQLVFPNHIIVFLCAPGPQSGSLRAFFIRSPSPRPQRGADLRRKEKTMFTPTTLNEIIKAAKASGADPAALLSVVEVESGGKFFAKVRGRHEPLIRFEGHYFDRRLSGSDQERARSLGLASPVAGRIRNPAAQEERWDMLDRACEISRDAALESVSWGIGQIMGAHWRALGYASAGKFVETARSGVQGQVTLLVRFIEANRLLAPLNKQDWETFARRYNGPGYRKNSYDQRLAAAYRRYERMIGTGSAPAQPEDPRENGPRPAEKSDAVRQIQLALTALGYSLEADGIFGGRTKAALQAFQRARALDPDGVPGPLTMAALQEASAAGQKRPSWLGALLRLILSVFGLLRR
jgi:hypothetical protein